MAASVGVFLYPADDPLPSTYAAQSQYDMEATYNRSALCTPIQDEVVFARSPSRCCNTPGSCRSPPPLEISTKADISGQTDARTAILQQYFKSTGALARSILLERASVECEHAESWTALSDSRKDALVDSHFVPMEVREQYEGAFIGGRGHRTMPRSSQRRLATMQIETEREWDGGNQMNTVSRKINYQSFFHYSFTVAFAFFTSAVSLKPVNPATAVFVN